MTTEYIDVTPTIEASMVMLLSIIKNGRPSDAKWAEQEILKYGRWIDAAREKKNLAAA